MNEHKLAELEYSVLRKYLRMSGACGKSEEFRLADAMARELTPRQRQIAEMYYIDQKNMESIARELGVSISTVCRTLGRGRARLRRCLRYGGSVLLKCAEEKL